MQKCNIVFTGYLKNESREMYKNSRAMASYLFFFFFIDYATAKQVLR